MTVPFPLRMSSTNVTTNFREIGLIYERNSEFFLREKVINFFCGARCFIIVFFWLNLHLYIYNGLPINWLRCKSIDYGAYMIGNIGR